MWLPALGGFLFAAAAAAALEGEPVGPSGPGAAGGTCRNLAGSNQASDEVAMMSLDRRSLLNRTKQRVARRVCTYCMAEGASGVNIGCKKVGSRCLKADREWHYTCDECCPDSVVENKDECRKTSNPEQTPFGTVDYDKIVDMWPAYAGAGAGFMAAGCVGPTHVEYVKWEGNDYITYPRNGGSPEVNSLFFNGTWTCPYRGFYLRAPPNSGRGGCIKYGDDVVIAQTADTRKTQNCGWYGCRVAKMVDLPSGSPPAAMAFGHGGDTPTSFFLQPPVGSGLSGCIQKNGVVVIAQTGNVVKEDTCGWYGCRVALWSSVSGYSSMYFDHGGEEPPVFILSAA
mmetsp:Transcript_5548/g.16687  ORF Transcript_5548/g.16687 Transcript_5548/m.16687 type:complete len:341 (+) Transcript_5548:104-1126(+)